jgi:hypothetical protein
MLVLGMDAAPSPDSPPVASPRRTPSADFFVLFFKTIAEINPTDTYFQDLAPLCHVSPVGATHEAVTPYALT